MLPQLPDLPQVLKATKLIGPFKRWTTDVGVDRGPNRPNGGCHLFPGQRHTPRSLGRRASLIRAALLGVHLADRPPHRRVPRMLDDLHAGRGAGLRLVGLDDVLSSQETPLNHRIDKRVERWLLLGRDVAAAKSFQVGDNG